MATRTVPADDKDFRPYMTKMFTGKSNPDYVDLYEVDDEEPITWGELMRAIDDMEWFIVTERYSKVRQGANWILWWVVRKLKVHIMARKGLLKDQVKAAKRKKKLTPSV